MDEGLKGAGVALAPSRLVAFGRLIARRLLLRAGVAAVLEVPGRRTGKATSVTLGAWEIDGSIYLMSQYGVTDWVRNLRAAGRGNLVHAGRRRAFKAVEVDGDERDRVIAAFRAKADKQLSRDFDRLPNAADHPTFRVEPLPSA
jgi:deazaflavin-dependent oxidoreductase (nitroreductase family)